MLSRYRNLLPFISFLLPFLISLSAGANSHSEHLSIKFKIDVADAGSKHAEDVLRTHIVAYLLPYTSDLMWDKYFADQRVGDVLLDTVDVSRESTSLQDLKRRIRELGPLVKRIVDAGGRVQLVFQNGIPKWLSSDPHNHGDLFAGGLSEGQKIWHSVPPKSFELWEKVAYEFVDFFNNKMKTNGRVYYSIGSEPENYFVGSEEDWHKYYEHFTRGALKADPKARIGGGNTAGINEKHFNKYNPRNSGDKVVFQKYPTRNNNSIIYNWIEYCARKDLPIDFITWHDYPAPNPIPGETANWVAYERELNEWTSRFGFKDVEYILNDWPEWKPVPYENDSEFQAAYVVNSLITMIEHTEVKPLYLNIMDQGAYTDSKSRRKNASFGGGTGLFTSIGLAKPIFNAYALMSKMTGKLVHVDTGDEYVRALASVDQDKIYILLTNFIPSKRLIRQNTYGVDPEALREIDQKAFKQKMKKAGRSKKEMLASVFNGSIDIEQLDLPHEAEIKVKGMQKVYRESQSRAGVPAKASFSLSGFGKLRGGIKVEEYIIDKDHANSYSQREKIMEKARSSGIKSNHSQQQVLVKKVNRKTGIESGLGQSQQIEASSGRLELSTTLQPNSVHLMVLSRQKPGHY